MNKMVTNNLFYKLSSQPSQFMRSLCTIFVHYVLSHIYISLEETLTSQVTQLQLKAGKAFSIA